MATWMHILKSLNSSYGSPTDVNQDLSMNIHHYTLGYHVITSDV